MNLSIKDVEPFLIYSDDNAKSKKHLAVCYVISMDIVNTKFKLTSDEFVMKTGKTKSGHLLNVNEILKDQSGLEYWSKYILSHVFKKSISGVSDLFSQDV